MLEVAVAGILFFGLVTLFEGFYAAIPEEYVLDVRSVVCLLVKSGYSHQKVVEIVNLYN